MLLKKNDEALLHLRRASELGPVPQSMVNIAAIHGSRGEVDLARAALATAIDLTRSASSDLRIRTLQSTIPESWERMVQERAELLHSVPLLCAATGIGVAPSKINHVPIYTPYAGLLDKHLQDTMSDVYGKIFRMEEPEFSGNPRSAGTLVKIGFVSQFFGDHEPHGMLLDGIMNHLPRNAFHVVAFPIIQYEIGAKRCNCPLTWLMLNGVFFPQNAAAHFAFNHRKRRRCNSTPPGARRSCRNFEGTATRRTRVCRYHVRTCHTLCQLAAPSASPGLLMTIHAFMKYSCIHCVPYWLQSQLAFWGNPVTSASRHIDYFMSGDALEHPFRTRMTADAEPYREQVVLLDGQGIWYNKPTDVIR